MGPTIVPAQFQQMIGIGSRFEFDIPSVASGSTKIVDESLGEYTMETLFDGIDIPHISRKPKFTVFRKWWFGQFREVTDDRQNI